MPSADDIARIYDRIAKDFYDLRTTENPKGWFYNELLEMPTTLKLLGNIKNKKILDLGCGAGIYSKILVSRGARVKGIDISKREIEIAKKENPFIEFKVGDAEKLTYKNNEFDIVLAALVMEHFTKWDKILKGIRRVLKRKGLFVFSIGNPITNCINKNNKKLNIKKGYFKETEIKSRWWPRVYMPWHHKTYGTITKLLIKNRFELVDYEDAFPVKKAKKLFPKEYLETSLLPYFCTWKWRKK